MKYIPSENKTVKEIEYGLNLTRSLFVSSLLIGERYTGKKELVKRIFPNTPTVDASNTKELKHLLESEDELIIYNFDKIDEYEKIDFDNKRVIAIADISKSNAKLDKIFAFIYKMPSLKERPEDIENIGKVIIEEAKEILDIKEDISLDKKAFDIRENIKSLKSSIYKELIIRTMQDVEIENALYFNFLKTLKGENLYRQKLGILERPLLKAGLEIYNSQLQLSGKLGINRNTLRKKLNEYHID